MPYKTETVANSLLQRAFKEKRPDVTPLKLQKLIWFLNGWHLAIVGKPAVAEPFQVWKFGPVLSSIYHDVKKFGSGPITEYLKTYDEKSGEFKSYVVADSATQFQEVLDLTWEKYIGTDAIHLSSMTHLPESPWKVAKENGDLHIDNELIKKYFIGLARKRNANA